MVVNIKSEEDLNNFYRKLKKLKNEKLKINVTGDIPEKDKYELKQIEKVAGIKDRYEQLSVLFDELCDYLDKYIVGNICEFDEDGLCIAQRDGKQKIKVNGCCGKCIYVGKKGCTIRNITCKTFFCRYIKSIKEIPDYKESKLYKYFLTRSQKLFLETSFWQPKDVIIKKLYSMNMIKLLFVKDVPMKRY